MYNEPVQSNPLADKLSLVHWVEVMRVFLCFDEKTLTAALFFGDGKFRPVNQLPASPLPRVRVSGTRPPCCPEVSLAAPAHRIAFASGSPAPAPCVSNKPQNNQTIIDKPVVADPKVKLIRCHSIRKKKKTTVGILLEVPVFSNYYSRFFHIYC